MEFPSQRIRCDVLVVGGGLAALAAALEARKSAESVVVACKRKPGRSGNTIVSAAVFSACVAGEEEGDSPEQHLMDTVAGGCGLNDPALVHALVSESPERVMNLERYGVEFLRAGGRLVRRQPPGHSRPRSFVTLGPGCTPNTWGLSVTLPLLKAAEEWGITLLSNLAVHRLLVRDGVVGGALALDGGSGARVALSAGAVVLAAGGGGHLFASTNNTADATGDSYALALEAGARLRDMEFVQFYPAAMSSPARATIHNSMFSEGAVLRNRHGERFMPRYDPVNGDRATRDAMSQAIFHEIQAGNGVEGGVYMDCSGVPPAVLEGKFPSLAQLFRAHSIDLARQWLVVGPATHFVMGGVWIDARCRTGVAGLFAAGEAAGGVHGANRIPGNALSEALVLGVRAGREAAAHARGLTRAPDPPAAGLELPSPRPGSLSPAEVRAELRRAMWDHASIVRTEAGLLRARATLRECLDAIPRCRVATPGDAAALLELERMASAGLAIVAAALHRKESRGAHHRTDHPARDDARWLGSTVVERGGEELKVGFEPLPARHRDPAAPV